MHINHPLMSVPDPMNNPNPLVPQGSLQAAQGKSKVRVAVFTILAVHVFVLSGLLMQGCKRNTTAADATSTQDPNSLPPLTDSTVSNETAMVSTIPTNTLVEPSNYTANQNNISSPGVTSGATTSATPIASYSEPAPTQIPITPLPTSLTSGKEYSVARGDTLASIAKRHGVGWKAVQSANPGVNPAKLKVGQKIQIPESVASVATVGSVSTDSAKYTVKTGDSLTRIAKSHGTTAKAIKSANNLKNDRINVGQKLKIPSKGMDSASASNAASIQDSNLGGNTSQF